ncbi:DNA-binding transcriptional regulator, XRE-family HTH domain [Mucilaginibacter sp. OK268]|uniref:helix-turn-helix domain-containing protein n=1 Tax=Mucilaginibacter sp. OK268 TaxID=1881048 RepID=UPI000888D475|nr:helix-turn-helix transcriptional regulator [Mucilaginibacter sp. OK268]SDP86273.1 DNA-binding transcriptional regulator, XRE-family HTH domain [Mucilaginibacter sp. OK268]
MAESTVHIGRKIGRIRELKGMKQEVLAAALGISQQAISKIEQSADVEEDALQKIANVLGVPSEAIKNFSEEAVFNYFNNFHDNSTGDFRHHCTFNPLDKLMELVEENKQLYERLLQAEKEKNELLNKR